MTSEKMKRAGGRPKGVSSSAVEPETLGWRLRQVRESARLSIAEMADSMGLASDSQGKYERNQRSPDADYLGVFCAKFGISADWLLFGSGERSRPAPGQVPYDAEKMKLAMNVAQSLAAARGLPRGMSAEDWATEFYEFMVARRPKGE
jgi:transcriptional regulator with XRE-family HTH domain